MYQPNIHLVISHSAIGGKSNYENLVLEAIDCTLSALGGKVYESFYVALQCNYSLSKQEIPSNLATFASALESIFGSAAQILEIKIMQTISCKVNDFVFNPSDGAFNFVDYLTALQKHFG